ncbi:MAG: glycosyltransferase family 39 protein [Chitinivibrionia bacterium]|nr:glycosyltransferase family 39 protein [Chitinivibrionia bacterium]
MNYQKEMSQFINIKQKIQSVFEDEKLLLKIALALFAVWVVAQIVLIVCFWGHPPLPGTDIEGYVSIARRCFDSGQWYPNAQDVYSWFIWAPGFINYLILQLHIFGTVNFNPIPNLFMNIAMLFEIYYLGKKFFSKRTGLIAAVIFMLLPSNLFVVLGQRTENPFLFLCLSALCLVFSGKLKYIILAAILFALANWIRPLAIIFLFASVVYFVIVKTKIYNYFALIIPYILVILVIGTATEKKTGYFVYQSTTSGVNLMMTSHDKATGTFYSFDDGEIGVIENSHTLTFAEKDSIWKARSIEWIKKHPVKFTLLFLKKIPILYVNDGWAHPYKSSHSIGRFLAGKDAISIDEIIGILLKQALSSIPYYLTFLLFFYSLIINRKEILSVKSVFLVIFIAGTAITCIFPAIPRYHYPYIFPVIIYAAWGIDTKIKIINKKERG